MYRWKSHRYDPRYVLVLDVFRRGIISRSWHALISNIALSVNHLRISLARDTLRKGTFSQFFRESSTVEIYWCRHTSVVIEEARNLDTLRCWELCVRDANGCSILAIVAYKFCKKTECFFLFFTKLYLSYYFYYEIIFNMKFLTLIK